MHDLSSPKQASALLQKYGLRPQKRLGQNFLCDRNTLNRILRSANLNSEDAVLEIGGGLGALSLALAEVSSSVTVIEIDRHLEPALRESTASHQNIHLIFDDFLRLDPETLFANAFGTSAGIVVANIPYYITTPILERLITHKSQLKRIVLLMQLEVARRLTAPANSDEYGSISLYAQYHAEVELVGTVPKTVFLPTPEVNSAIVVLTPIHPGTQPVFDETRMFHIIRAAFSQRRKTLVNALQRAPASYGLGYSMDDRTRVEKHLEIAGIDGSRRGETLTLAEFARISDSWTPLDT